MGVRAHLLRGVVAGLVAGLLVGLLALLVAEPVIDRAITLESQRVTGEYQRALNQAIIDHHGDVAAAERQVPAPAPEVFSRRTQRFGLVLATTLFGFGVGGIFAIVYLLIGRRGAPGTPWRRSLGLAGALLTGLYLLPFIRYPANPPGVGDPATIDHRTLGYTLAIAIGALAVWGAWRLSLYLRARGADEPLRHTAVALTLVVALVLEFVLLPDNTGPVRVPADLLWDFRLRAVAAQLLLWGGIGGLFAVLTERAARRAARATHVRAALTVAAFRD
jgi:Probable cobalt transporter subunit (CbtA)